MSCCERWVEYLDHMCIVILRSVSATCPRSRGYWWVWRRILYTAQYRVLFHALHWNILAVWSKKYCGIADYGHRYGKSVCYQHMTEMDEHAWDICLFSRLKNWICLKWRNEESVNHNNIDRWGNDGYFEDAKILKCENKRWAQAFCPWELGYCYTIVTPYQEINLPQQIGERQHNLTLESMP